MNFFSKDCKEFSVESEVTKNNLEKEKKLKISFGLEKNVILICVMQASSVLIELYKTMLRKFGMYKLQFFY